MLGVVFHSAAIPVKVPSKNSQNVSKMFDCHGNTGLKDPIEQDSNSEYFPLYNVIPVHPLSFGLAWNPIPNPRRVPSCSSGKSAKRQPLDAMDAGAMAEGKAWWPLVATMASAATSC
nr:hypothetical protein Iba_chr06fCG1350 [Ipomoea batatas]